MGISTATPQLRMRPITFSCEQRLPLAAEEIARQVLDLAKWPDFHGCGPIPGIKSAVFEVQPPEVVGTRIRVTNVDGSVTWKKSSSGSRSGAWCYTSSSSLRRCHAWRPGMEETWEFRAVAGGTHVTRSFAMHPQSAMKRMPLWAISFLLKRAIARHLRELSAKQD
jgi:hypothetical protein